MLPFLPETGRSNYDIIVASKNKSILELYGANLELQEGIKVHLMTTCFTSTIEKLNTPEENLRTADLVCLLQFLWPSINDFSIYQTEEYKTIKNILIKYSDKICYFCLEKLLESLKEPQINLGYVKTDYHYICFGFLLSNFKQYNKLFLTSVQKEQLRTIKSTKKITEQIINSLRVTLFKQYQLWYKEYKEIYQEVIACQKQFT